MPLVDDLGHVDVVEHGDLVTVGIRRDGLDRARGYVDSLCALFFTFYAEHVEGFRISSLSFTQVRPAVVRPYVALFGVMPRFGSEQNRITFSRRFLDATIQGADPHVGALLRNHAEDQLERRSTEDPFLDTVRRALSRALSSGQASPEKVARASGVSERTLRRRLSALGTSYQELLDELRKELACHRLAHSADSVDVIGEVLGFSSRSAFQRAFRRFTGKSPSQYRADLTSR